MVLRKEIEEERAIEALISALQPYTHVDYDNINSNLSVMQIPTTLRSIDLQDKGIVRNIVKKHKGIIREFQHDNEIWIEIKRYPYYYYLPCKVEAALWTIVSFALSFLYISGNSKLLLLTLFLQLNLW